MELVSASMNDHQICIEMPAVGARQLLMNFASLTKSSEARGMVMTRKMLRPVALIGTVATMLTVTIVLTLSHATSMSGVIGLKCYGTNLTQKAC